MYQLLKLLICSALLLCPSAKSQSVDFNPEKPNRDLDSAIYETENYLINVKSDTTAYINLGCHLSKLYCKKSQYVKAERLLESFFKILKTENLYHLRGLVYNSLGNCYKLKNETALALHCYLQAEKFFIMKSRISALISLYVDMAEYFRSLGQYQDAKKYIQKSHDLYFENNMDEPANLIRVYNRFAAIANENIAGDSSLLLSKKAIELSRKIGDLNSEAISLNEIGFSMKNRLNVDSSARCYKRAIEIWTQIGRDIDAIHAKYNLAMLMSHNNFPKKDVIKIYKEIIHSVKEKQLNYPIDQVYFMLAHAYYFNGDSLDCYRTRQLGFEALLEKNRKIFDTEVNNIKERYENEKYRNQISKVSSQLQQSETDLNRQKSENRIIYSLLGVLGLLLVTIGFMAKKIYSSNKILSQKNKEKDGLIQEIHHRVKNNLQFISSLINMQINTSKSSLEVESLNDTSRRIRSMALVHEMLYTQTNESGIEIKKYLEELTDSINDLVNSKKLPITFTIDCEEFEFETPTAIALGMIASELVSNSIKYAFKETGNPVITIELKKRLGEDEFTFVVKDNGVGLTEPVTNSTEKLGMRLINIFSRQIKGAYTLTNNNGLVYKLNFKYSK